MAVARTEDLISSVENYIQTAWPDSNIQWMPDAHEAWSEYSGTQGDVWAVLDVVGPRDQIPNRDNVVVLDVRILIFSRENDRLASVRRADEFVLLLNDTAVTFYDRTDGGATELGKIVFQTATASGPTLDERGYRLSIVEVEGWVYPD